MNVKFAIAGFLGLLLSASAGSAGATNLVTNGSFTNFTPPPDGSSAFYSTLNNTDAPGWQTTSGYSFVVNASQATGGFNGPDGAVSLYGPITASPDGGNFLAADGAYETGYTYTTVSGLSVGQRYTVSFYQAAGQQTGYSGSTTDLWTVGLGSTYANSTFVNSTLMSLPSQSFSGWQLQSVSFTALPHPKCCRSWRLAPPAACRPSPCSTA